jgi:magnesium-protoporphyrin IX monomethyl ester (oxidative) cyclase
LSSISETKRLLLINPPQTYPKNLEEEYQSYLPVGLACIASIAEEAGFEVKILDCLEDETYEINENEVCFGKTKTEIQSFLQEFKPDIVGISSIFTMFVNDANSVARLVKNIDNDIIVFIGGTSATLKDIYQDLLINECYDIIVKGEGEYTVKELLQNYCSEHKIINNLSAIKGIAYKENGLIKDNEKRDFINNLGELPFPAIHLLNIKKIINNRFYSRWRLKQKSMPIFTSRGCPYNCIFCSVHSQVGYKNRTFPIEYVTRFITDCKEKYGIEHFHFEDDNLTFDKARAKQLFKELKRLNITWDTPNGVRADTIDEEMLKLMIESGLKSITIAAESGNERVLNKIIKKNLSIQSVINAAALADKYNLPCIVFFIVGFPGETLTDISDTIQFAKNLTLSYGTINIFFVANPLPGTELESIAKVNGFIKKKMDSSDYFVAIRVNQRSIIETDAFNKKIIFNLMQSELRSDEYSVNGTSMPRFWRNTPKTWERAKKAMPDIDTEKKFVWEWID